jgi:hypothetical protein
VSTIESILLSANILISCGKIIKLFIVFADALAQDIIIFQEKAVDQTL